MLKCFGAARLLHRRRNIPPDSPVPVVSLANAHKHTRFYMTRPDIAENKSDSIGFEAEPIH